MIPEDSSKPVGQVELQREENIPNLEQTESRFAKTGRKENKEADFLVSKVTDFDVTGSASSSAPNPTATLNTDGRIYDRKGRGKASFPLLLSVLMFSGIVTGLGVWKRDLLMENFPIVEPIFRTIGFETPHPKQFFKIRKLSIRQKQVDGILIKIINWDVENISSRPRVIPLFEGVILDNNKKVLKSWDIPSEAVKIMPNERRPFSTELKNPGGIFRIMLHRRSERN